MSNMFGGGSARAEAKRQQAQARQEIQTASEETTRAQQKAERGGGGVSRGRNMLMGSLAGGLKKTLGA